MVLILQPQGNVQYALNSMKAREAWETEFQRQFLSLVFRDTETVINQSHQVINEAGKGTERPLQRSDQVFILLANVATSHFKLHTNLPLHVTSS